MSLKRSLLERLLSNMPRERRSNILRILAESLEMPGLVVSGANGQFVVPTYDQIIGSAYLNTKQWDPGTVQLIRKELALGGTLIDVGANIGLITCAIAAMPNVQVVSFEPNPENFRMLSSNCALNGVVDQVSLHQCALSNATGQIELEMSPTNSGDHRLRIDGVENSSAMFNEESRGLVLVDTIPLDDIVDSSLLEGRVVTKIDVQGAEELVVSGAKRCIERTDLLLLEYWPYGLSRLGANPKNFLRELVEQFRTVAIYSPENTEEDIQMLKLADYQIVIDDFLERAGNTAHLDLMFRR